MNMLFLTLSIVFCFCSSLQAQQLYITNQTSEPAVYEQRITTTVYRYEESEDPRNTIKEMPCCIELLPKKLRQGIQSFTLTDKLEEVITESLKPHAYAPVHLGLVVQQNPSLKIITLVCYGKPKLFLEKKPKSHCC